MSLLAVNIFGAYIKLVTEAFHTRTFTETYDHIKARMVLEKERTRQVRKIKGDTWARKRALG